MLGPLIPKCNHLQDALLDTVMLRLRTADGLDMEGFRSSYGSEATSAVHRALEPHMKTGLVLTLPRLPTSRNKEEPSSLPITEGADGERGIIDRKWDFRVRLSDPDGFLLSNSIISDVFASFSFKS